MPGRLPDFEVPFRPSGAPINPALGIDWLSNLSRFAQAERMGPSAAGAEMLPQPGGSMPVLTGDEGMRRMMLIRALMGQR